MVVDERLRVECERAGSGWCLGVAVGRDLRGMVVVAGAASSTTARGVQSDGAAVRFGEPTQPLTLLQRSH